MIHRFCRIGVCEGDAEQPGEICPDNGDCESECLDFVVNGHNYIGTVNKDYMGRVCEPWLETVIGRTHR